jgi:hypothetical protein
MSANKKYIKFKFKVMFNNLTSPVMYAELYNGKYTKTFLNDNKEITSDHITKNEYAAALAHILLRENGYKYLNINFNPYENNDNNTTT